MPRLFTHHSSAGTAGHERVFTDDRGRLGSAAPTGCGTPRGALCDSSLDPVAHVDPTARPIPIAGRR
jgi:hypothetical protein